MLHSGLMIGGKYNLTMKLGSGAYGSVWDAVDITNNTQVAIKFVS